MFMSADKAEIVLWAVDVTNDTLSLFGCRKRHDAVY